MKQQKLAEVYEILPRCKKGRPPESTQIKKPPLGFWGPRYERDIELLFIEPLLKRLGYGRGSCWFRPNYVIGGVEIIPDYSFGNYNRPSMILESKYRIHTTNEFFRAYKQVSKYGDLLGCKVVCTASLDGLWVFPRVDNVFNEFIHFNWDQTMSDSSFEEIKGLIGTATNLHLHT